MIISGQMPKFNDSSERIDYMLIRRMVLYMFNAFVATQPDPVEYYKNFLKDFEAEVSKMILNQVADLHNKTQDKNGFYKMMFNMMGVNAENTMDQLTKDLDSVIKTYLTIIPTDDKDNNQ